MNKITYGGGSYIAWKYSPNSGERSHQVRITKDGRNWSKVDIGSQSDYKVVACAYGGGRWISILRAHSTILHNSQLIIHQSLDDGMSWQQLSGITVPNLMIDADYQLLFAEGRWILTGRSLGSAITNLPNPNRVWFSIDAIDWQDRSPGGLPYLPVSAYGNGVLVIVGGDKIFRSVDFGLTWTSLTIETPVNLTSISYGNSIFVAGGTRKTLKSTDGGVSWTEHALTNNSVSFVEYGSGMFLRSVGNLQTSKDGTTWTNIISNGWPIYWSGDAAYGSSGFLLVNDNGKNGLQSIDGMPPSVPTTYATNGIVGENYSASLQAPGATFYEAQNLPPGLTLNPTNGQISGIPTAIGTYYAIGYAANSAGFGDSKKFTIQVKNPGGLEAPYLNSNAFSVGAAVNRIAYGGGKYLAWKGYFPNEVEQSSEIILSQDGEIWDRLNIAGQSERKVVACGSDGTRWLSVLRVYNPPTTWSYSFNSILKIYESLNGGTSWEELQGVSMPSQSIDDNYSLIFAGGNWVLAGNSFGSPSAPKAEAKVWISQDGVTWVDRSVDGLSYNPIVAYGDGVLVVVGEGGLIYRSQDFGETWSSVAVPMNLKLTSVAFGNGRFVVGGEKGAVFTSMNGALSWMPQTLDDRVFITGITYGAGLFYMRTNRGSETSYDGIWWTKSQDFGTNGPATSTYGSSGFVSVFGPSSTVLKAAGQGQFDLLPPQVAEFSITPTLVDISNSEARISITSRIIDDTEGFDWGVLGILKPDGDAYYLSFSADQRVSGTANDGTYQQQITVPRYGITGVYAMCWFYLHDSANRSSLFMPQQFSDSGFSSSFTVQGTSDQAGPQIVELQIEPGIVDITDASQEITVTARITDDLSGFESAQMTFSAGPNASSYGVGFDSGKRISGTSADGLYRQKITLPRYATTGTFLVSWCQLRDFSGRSRIYTAQEIADLGLDISFTVSGLSDQAAPQITELSIEPANVNISDSTQMITLTARITDDLAGLNFASLTFSSPSGNKSFGVYLDSTKRISGTALDGVYRQVITLPRYSVSGLYSLSNCTLQDAAWRSRNYSAQQFADLGFPSSFTLTGVSDLGAPVIKSLSISPGTVDISNASQLVTITAVIEDDLSGLNWMNINLSKNPMEAGFWAFFSTESRISGNAMSGVYQTTIRVLRSASPGTYQINVCNLMDFSGQDRSYTALQLISMGQAHSLEITGTPTIDLSPPVLNLIGPATLIVGKYAIFSDPGAQVVDNLDVSGVIYSQDLVDTSQAGSFTLNYFAQDEQGNLADPISRTVIVAQDIEDWLGDFPPSWEIAQKYVFGGASSPVAESEPLVLSMNNNELVLSVIVRTNDPNVSVWGEGALDLAGLKSPSSRQTISGTPTVNQDGVQEGFQRQEFRLNSNGLERGFIRVRADIGP